MPKKLSTIMRASAVASVAAKNRDAAGPPSLALATLKKVVGLHPYAASPTSVNDDTLSISKSRKYYSEGVSALLKRLRKAGEKKSDPSSSSQGSAEVSPLEISKEIASILHGSNEATTSDTDGDLLLKNVLNISSFSNMTSNLTPQRRKEILRERKQRYIFKNTKSRRFEKLMRTYAEKLGTESIFEVFGILGKETGVTEYNTLIRIFIDKARQSTANEALLQIYKAYQVFASMRERGFQIEEESYSPLLMYMIDMRMTEEFTFFIGMIKDEEPRSCSRLGYYEMLLCIRVGDEGKIQELCNDIGSMDTEDSYSLAESYLVAFCDCDRKVELLQLLKVLDIAKISSWNYVASIFKSLGRLNMEDFVEKFVLELKMKEIEDKEISLLIYEYAVSIPNLLVDEVARKFRNLHETLGIIPSTKSYDKLILFCCNSLKVGTAVDVAEQMCKSGLAVSVETLHMIVQMCERCCELDKVRPLYVLAHKYNLRPKADTFKSMICLYLKMKDFEGAYNVLTYAEEIHDMPTTSMYNAIMAGHFREKNIHGALMVLEQMEDADIKPDSETFSYLIANSRSEKDVAKYYDEMQRLGIQVTKHVYMALINAYANFGKFEMAKQVALEPKLPEKSLFEIKSVLVSALASNGQMPDALNLYNEMKQGRGAVDPKAVISLIEHFHSCGETERMLHFLEDLEDTDNWSDGCSRVILYCVRNNLADSAIDLLKQLQKRDQSSTYIVLDQIFSQLWEMEPTNMDISLKLLKSIKVDLGLHLSRTSLDFLLSTCTKARDGNTAQMIWSEYKETGLPYNSLTFLRMYQALLASGDQEAASKVLKKIPKCDPHVLYIIKASEMAYTSS